jgi:hypothetical protein
VFLVFDQTGARQEPLAINKRKKLKRKPQRPSQMMMPNVGLTALNPVHPVTLSAG